jgi:YD repeat-containing protein
MMRLSKLGAVLAAGLLTSSIAGAAQTVTYGYDALGRLTEVHVLGGPGSGIAQSFQYDAAGNRQSQTTSAPGQTAVALSVPNAVTNVTSTGITLTVNVSGSAPGGTVTFTENGVFLGVAYVVGGQASISLESFPPGAHSIRATYSGDGTYAPQVSTFNIKVVDIRWLPAVLELLLSE